MDRAIVLSVVLGLIVTGPVAAQQSSGQQTLAATLKVYVFPAEGQTGDQQSKDEAECYQWANQNTGIDPFELAKQTEAQQQQAAQKQKEVSQSTQGAGVKGAVGGAAAGALIGEIASNDAGEGAAYGAAAGAIIARRRAKSAQLQAQTELTQQTQQAQTVSAEQLAGFKKAFAVCLEAKKYLVKY